MVDFSKFQIKEESKKTPKASMEASKGKIVPKEVQKIAQPQKKMQKSKDFSKNQDVGVIPTSGSIDKNSVKASKYLTEDTINKKINELVNEQMNKMLEEKLLEFERDLNKNALELMAIGSEHKLTIENIIEYFKKVPKSKPYELRRFFSHSTLWAINRNLKFLYNQKILIRDKNNFYYLNKNKIN